MRYFLSCMFVLCASAASYAADIGSTVPMPAKAKTPCPSGICDDCKCESGKCPACPAAAKPVIVATPVITYTYVQDRFGRTFLVPNTTTTTTTFGIQSCPGGVCPAPR